jgi:hypothetical protein
LQLSAIKINLDVHCAYINDTRKNDVSTIERARIDHIHLGDFLEENEAMLKKVSQKKYAPPKHDLFTNKSPQITMKTKTLISRIMK